MAQRIKDDDLARIKAAPDDRQRQATIIAQSIASDIVDRVKVPVELVYVNGAPGTFGILWNGANAGRLQIFIPRGTYGPERVRFALHTPRNNAARNYTKMSTVINKIVDLCRPLSEQELASEASRSRGRELTERIAAIEGGGGSIGRYPHAHRIALASWLAGLPEGGVPHGLEILAARMRGLVQEAAQLRAERAELTFIEQEE